MACAALLHDAVEDHAEDIAPGWHSAVRVRGTSQPVRRPYRRAAAAVTNPAYEPGRDEHEQYREHVTASLHSSPWARIIKVSDFTDNAVGLVHTTGPKLAKLARKYRPLVPALCELILRPDTPLALDVKNKIAGQLRNAEERFAAICYDDEPGNSPGQPSAAQIASS